MRDLLIGGVIGAVLAGGAGSYLLVQDQDEDAREAASAFVHGIGLGGCAESRRRDGQSCEPRVNEISISAESDARTEHYIVLDGLISDGDGNRVRELPGICTGVGKIGHDRCTVTFNE